MDDIVKQALAKWPNVPDCYGWLGLDARGRWYLRDDATQVAGAFPQSKGQLLEHDKLIAFIERNYEADAGGQCGVHAVLPIRLAGMEAGPKTSAIRRSRAVAGCLTKPGRVSAAMAASAPIRPSTSGVKGRP